MTTSFHYQSPRVEEDAAFLDLNLPNVAVDDFSCMPQFDTYPAADCESIDLSKLDDISLDSLFWDNFNPDLFASTEPSIPLSTSALNDGWSTDLNSLPDPSSISFDTPQMGQASPNFFSPDTTFAESALPSPELDDSNQRLNWVKSTLKDLALARAAKDTRPVSQRTKQMDASIELYLQLQNDINSGFQGDCNPAAQSMVWQHSSTAASDSSFDTNSFSVTGSPSSSTGTVPELSPASMTRAGSASAAPSRAALPPAAGGVEMVLDMNLNEATALPRKHRPKTHEERQRYITVRRQGACEWHRKQRKRCTCVDKTESAITTVKRKKLMKQVQKTSQHCSGAVLPLSGGDHFSRSNVRPPSRPLESSSALHGCLAPDITWQCSGDPPCNGPQCLYCCCVSDEPTTPPLQVMAQARVVRQAHKPIINRETLQFMERKSPTGLTDYDPGHALQSLPPDLPQSRIQTQHPIPSRPQDTLGSPGAFGPVRDLHIHIIASPGRPSSSLDPQLSSGSTGDTSRRMPAHSGDRLSGHRRVDAAVFAPMGAEDRPPSSRLSVLPESPTIRVDGDTINSDGQQDVASPAQTEKTTTGTATLGVDRVVRLILRTMLRLATRFSSLLPPSTKLSRECYHPLGKMGIPHAIRNESTSHPEWREPSLTMSVLLLAWGCLFVSPIIAIVAFIVLSRATRSHSKSSKLRRAAKILRIYPPSLQARLNPTREQCAGTAKMPVTPMSLIDKQATVTGDRQLCISRHEMTLTTKAQEARNNLILFDSKQSNRLLIRNIPTVARMRILAEHIQRKRTRAYENSAFAGPSVLVAPHPRNHSTPTNRATLRSHHDYPAPMEPDSPVSCSSQQTEER
ncbi:hypothetical protein GX51_07603 [Blastomyces parvus]|uniref:Uncharacterized protein n=1 Tax=Blastomyces parvus TaxID=2060905 RepID=A0A2B7WK77_9EURO|nr:hypothetical protein GX51_07603 [Blastomyces parvus]